MKMTPRIVAGVIALSALVLGASPAFAEKLDQRCTATMLNRTAPVNSFGGFAIPNVPAERGIYRVRVSCERNGRLVRGQSQILDLVPNAETPVGPIEFGRYVPVPQTLKLYAQNDKVVLQRADETVQLFLWAIYGDGRVTTLDGRLHGTVYISSNPAIATVDEDGLVTAVARGPVNIIAVNEGIAATIDLMIDLPQDRDGDGLPDDYERRNGLNMNDPTDAAIDLDGDGLSNLDEYRNNSLPRTADTDGDGINDGEEVARGLRPDRADTDRDGLIDGDEDRYGTNPLIADTDGDGLTDGDEVRLGFRPTEVDETTEVVGQVVDPDGAAVEDAVVIIARRFVGNTDAAGNFRIAPVSADARRLTAEVRRIKDGEVLDGRGVAAQVVPSGTTDMGVIRLRRILNAVGGHISSPRGEPVPDARVTVSVGLDERGANANQQGDYLVRFVREGDVTVIATDPDTGLRGRAYGVLDPDASVTIDVQLSASGTIEGTVFNRADQPVGPGIPVTLRGPVNLESETDEVGRYRFDFIPLGLYTLEAFDPAGNRGRTTAAITNTNQVVPADISFLGVGRVTGLVETGGGALVANARVTLVGRGPFGGRFETQSDAQGSFAFNSVFVGPFDVSVQDPRSGLAGVSSGSIDFEGDEAQVTVTLRGAGSFSGVVYESDAATPVPGAVVQFDPSGRQVVADAQGAFHIDFLPLGNYTLTA
ncbi:MAG: Ig-like domain-containing protein, partial [Myxococcales bacterium]|nr:Ig-like domain-containing protein [Myxococcales bacterium]